MCPSGFQTLLRLGSHIANWVFFSFHSITGFLLISTWSCMQLQGCTLCFAMVLPGRKSGFRVGFLQDSNRESLTIGHPAGLRPDVGPILRAFG